MAKDFEKEKSDDECLFNELERMADDSKGILTLCAFSDCRKMKVPLGDEPRWIKRDDYPEKYDEVIENYETRFKLGEYCISHGYCPKHLEEAYKEIDEME